MTIIRVGIIFDMFSCCVSCCVISNSQASSRRRIMAKKDREYLVSNGTSFTAYLSFQAICLDHILFCLRRHVSSYKTFLNRSSFSLLMNILYINFSPPMFFPCFEDKLVINAFPSLTSWIIQSMLS